MIGVLQVERNEQGIDNLFEEIMAENFPKLGKEKVTQVQEAQRVSIKMNPKRTPPRHTIIKWQKLKTKRESLK